jgi:hypothetical protein
MMFLSTVDTSLTWKGRIMRTGIYNDRFSLSLGGAYPKVGIVSSVSLTEGGRGIVVKSSPMTSFLFFFQKPISSVPLKL